MQGYQQFCGLARALDLIGDRWNLLIVRELLIRERRHTELRSALPGVASNLLTDRLRHLVAAGIVERRQEEGRKAVVYALTPRGADLREPVLGLVRWGAPLMASGPRPGDTVQPQWLALAALALLRDAVVTRPGRVALDADGLDLTVHAEAAGVRVELAREDRPDARVQGPTALVLGLLAGALSARTAAAMGARVQDDAGVLDALLVAAAAGRAA
ncbi:helix-turn-helix domain-containing protein [Cellulomonas sp.]|uniref:winged helix-turn-helix transcriptional regulator n=1 Tax=Cellulomonas sp. TaxID=40001 RepID=UPI00258FE25C|nr:helix-turn-helix domain-containing protein [Cellulomonas sp.]MCR6687986.1 helix-turn-helix transcriptional regulator [Cellulomonas sp.]